MDISMFETIVINSLYQVDRRNCIVSLSLSLSLARALQSSLYNLGKGGLVGGLSRM